MFRFVRHSVNRLIVSINDISDMLKLVHTDLQAIRGELQTMNNDNRIRDNRKLSR